jgi:predicted HAD superfamily phosphohydrolase YqeG
MFICVDFDGTIVDHQYPEIGQPVPNALKWLKTFNEQGANIILFTMRSDEKKKRPVLTEAVDYLKANGIKLFAVNENPTQASWTNSPKAYGHFYIDDSAVGCPLIHPEGFSRPCVDWEKIGEYMDAAV